MTVVRTILGRLLSRRHRLAVGVVASAALIAAVAHMPVAEAATTFNAHLTRAPVPDRPGRPARERELGDRSVGDDRLAAVGAGNRRDLHAAQHDDGRAQRRIDHGRNGQGIPVEGRADAARPGHLLLPAVAGRRRSAGRQSLPAVHHPGGGRSTPPRSRSTSWATGAWWTATGTIRTRPAWTPRSRPAAPGSPSPPATTATTPAARSTTATCSRRARHQRDLRAELLDRGRQQHPPVHCGRQPRPQRDLPHRHHHLDRRTRRCPAPAAATRTAPTTAAQAALVNYGSEWYAFNAGPARFYILDSAWGDTNGGTATPYANDYADHFSPTLAEYQWLLADLQTHPGVTEVRLLALPVVLGQLLADLGHVHDDPPAGRHSEPREPARRRTASRSCSTGTPTSTSATTRARRACRSPTSPAAAGPRSNRSRCAQPRSPTGSAGHRPSSRATRAARPRCRHRPARSSTS